MQQIRLSQNLFWCNCQQSSVNHISNDLCQFISTPKDTFHLRLKTSTNSISVRKSLQRELSMPVQVCQEYRPTPFSRVDVFKLQKELKQVRNKSVVPHLPEECSSTQSWSLLNLVMGHGHTPTQDVSVQDEQVLTSLCQMLQVLKVRNLFVQLNVTLVIQVSVTTLHQKFHFEVNSCLLCNFKSITVLEDQ